MDKYDLTINCKGYDVSDDEAHAFESLVESYMRRLIDVAHFQFLDVESVYLIKATNCAPEESKGDIQ